MTPTLQILYPEVWKKHLPTLRPLVEAALKYANDDWTFEQVEAQVLRGQLLAFASFDGPKPAAVLLGQYVYYPGKTVFLITFAAGGFKGYETTLAQISSLVKAGGASELEAWCRSSIARYLTRFGFSRVYEVVRKPL